MYLFSINKKIFNSSTVFYKLTQKETIDLTDERLHQFLFNILTSKKYTCK